MPLCNVFKAALILSGHHVGFFLVVLWFFKNLVYIFNSPVNWAMDQCENIFQLLFILWIFLVLRLLQSDFYHWIIKVIQAPVLISLYLSCPFWAWPLLYNNCILQGGIIIQRHLAQGVKKKSIKDTVVMEADYSACCKALDNNVCLIFCLENGSGLCNVLGPVFVDKCLCNAALSGVPPSHFPAASPAQTR